MAKPKKPTKAALEAYEEIVELSNRLGSLSKSDAASLNELIQRVHFTVVCDNDFMELDEWISLSQIDLFDGVRVFLYSQHNTEPLDNGG
jgi:hypothetical protein